MNRSRVEQHTKIQAHHLERAAYVYVRQSIWRVDAGSTSGPSGHSKRAGPASASW
ncbi:MAG: hypothetical protein ACREBC_00120 [Pyrinomonadaceae bacterium]